LGGKRKFLIRLKGADCLGDSGREGERLGGWEDGVREERRGGVRGLLSKEKP
jgi:hypothetical protein